MQIVARRLCERTVPYASRCIRLSLVLSQRQTPYILRRQLSVTVDPRQDIAHAIPTESVSPAPLQGIVHQTDGASIEVAAPAAQRAIPFSCPGCGALSQQTEKQAPGHYTRTRRTVRDWLKGNTSSANGHASEDTSSPPDAKKAVASTAPSNIKVPLCDRCHDLVNSNKGTSIAHPSIEDIADSIAESPYRQNHVYHVLDAADFPMSLVPAIHRALELAKPRSRNRRSQHNYSSRPTMSFVITRSDLLAPTKAKVDRLLPYFREILRSTLTHVNKDMRLGNLHLVSAKRGWWTKELKDEIWQRGGGNWLVGKFNVGKSNLFEVIFPKGSGERAPVYKQLVQEQSKSDSLDQIPAYLPESQLLPPAQPEVPFPTLPLVSSLPGTTASPIRLPFGNKKGELIDMPGLERGDLDHFVAAEHRLDLVMENRPKITQYSIKPGQSLLLGGGVVRITPLLSGDKSTTMLAYPFVPLDAHITATDKAIGAQEQSRESGIESILAPEVGGKFRSAGIITLDVDVTKYHAGSVLRAGANVDRLPFRVYGKDILIQGVGWVEVTCQVRRRRGDTTEPETTTANADSGSSALAETSDSAMPPSESAWSPQNTIPQFDFPQVEVFSPNGAHISSRRPMNAWTLFREGTLTKERNKPIRPRMPMKGEKKAAKIRTRAAAGV
ncbi:uncharacterized protein AB675_6870 [Cyphellophora attinorum]|uniref:Genetic interactor of prohibitins 3, mitochondrial n=1 Tax=Cyphellophora attinorum TaxID=1664694 RepID=A0A0N1HUQ7_9EURO|nr:uncharacterized protein AB675_6870 [Phialophora attinorum]KPI43200.1 hypothetical protein AB675_6870 [Phialophora attinorum]